MPRKIKKIHTEKKLWKVGIYCRLSSDDGDNAESDSISNQKQIIKDTKYAIILAVITP